MEPSAQLKQGLQTEVDRCTAVTLQALTARGTARQEPRPTNAQNQNALADGHTDVKAWKKRITTAEQAYAVALAAQKQAQADLADLFPPQKEQRFATIVTKNVPAFARTLTTTPRECEEFLAKYSTFNNNHNVPHEQNGKTLFFNAMNAAFDASGQPCTLREADWLKEQRDNKCTWGEFCALFIAEFALSKHHGSKRDQFKELCKKGQDGMTVNQFFLEFCDLAAKATFTGAPPADWKTNNASIAESFVGALNKNLTRWLLNNKANDFMACSHNLEASSAMAAEAEITMKSVALMRTRLDPSQAAPLKGNKGNPANTSNKGGFSPRQPNTRGDNNLSNTKVAKCTRCFKTHFGGAANCWATVDAKRNTITSPPTAVRDDGKVGGFVQPLLCKACGSKGHTTATCPQKASNVQGGGRPKAFKKRNFGENNNQRGSKRAKGNVRASKQPPQRGSDGDDSEEGLEDESE
jgi:hypothetical protein